MKKLVVMLCACFGFMTGSNAQTQQIIDLTTGTSPVGTPDPIWHIELMPGPSPAPAITSNGTLCDLSSSTVGASFPDAACGNWISPFTVTTPGPVFGMMPNDRIDNTLLPPGHYKYRMTFTTYECQISNAVININLAGADNSLTNIIVNGNPNFTPPPGITYSSLDPMAH